MKLSIISVVHYANPPFLSLGNDVRLNLPHQDYNRTNLISKCTSTIIDTIRSPKHKHEHTQCVRAHTHTYTQIYVVGYFNLVSDEGSTRFKSVVSCFRSLTLHQLMYQKRLSYKIPESS